MTVLNTSAARKFAEHHNEEAKRRFEKASATILALKWGSRIGKLAAYGGRPGWGPAARRFQPTGALSARLGERGTSGRLSVSRRSLEDAAPSRHCLIRDLARRYDSGDAGDRHQEPEHSRHRSGGAPGGLALGRDPAVADDGALRWLPGPDALDIRLLPARGLA
jgi:hypothetical protein